MKYWKSALVLSLFAWNLAAQASTTVRTRETYPATDETSLPEDMSGLPVEVTSSVQVKTEIKTAAPKAIAKTTPAPAPATIPAAAPTLKADNRKRVVYDSVPTAQVAPVLERLKLVEAMIHDYGRAYDYRAYTLSELKEIQAHLASQAAVGAPPAIAPAAPAQLTTAPDLKSLPTPIELDRNAKADERED